MRGLIGAVVKRTRYGTVQIVIEVKSDAVYQKLQRKFRLLGIFLHEKGDQ